MSATLRQVAELAGVDPSTVSRVLRSDPGLLVRPDTKERILKAANELQYHPNASARSLKLRRTQTLGMVVPEITNSVYAMIFKGVEATARSAGYHVLLVNADQSQGENSYFPDLLVEKQVAGLILATATTTSPQIVHTLLAQRHPFVLVNRRYPELQERYVVADDAAAARLAVEHLIQLGHIRIAHISGPLFTDTGQIRMRSYLQTLSDFGIHFESSWMRESYYRDKDGYEAMHHLLNLPQRPTAVFCAADQIAIGAMVAIRERGLRIPHDISVVGVSNMPWSQYFDPPLTTVHVPHQEMGSEACRMLLKLLNDEPLNPASVTLPVHLVRRGSTGPPLHSFSESRRPPSSDE